MCAKQKSLNNLVEKLRQEQEFVRFYKSQIRTGVQELNKSCDNAFHSLWLCHTLNFTLTQVFCHHIAPHEWSMANEQSVEFINAANVLPSHTHVDHYSKFLSSLLTQTKLVSDILQIADAKDLDTQCLLNDLMSVVFGHCLFQRDHIYCLNLLHELINQQIRYCSSPKDLFGSESVLSKTLAQYCSQLTEFKAFLLAVLTDTVKEVIAFDDYLEFDVGKAGRRFHSNAERDSGLINSSAFLFGEDLEWSCQQLARLANTVMKKLGDTSLPVGLQWLLGCVKRALRQKWPQTLEQERRVLADALFGNIMSSALVNPDLHAIVGPGVVLGSVARYNLTQLMAVLQRSAWGVDKDPVIKVVKKMDMELYCSVLDGLDGGSTKSLPNLPLHLPGLKRSSFLASQSQLHNLVGLAASLLSNREGRGVFRTQVSEILSSLPHALIDAAPTNPYTPLTVLPSFKKHTHTQPTTLQPQKKNKKRGSMTRTAHNSVDSVPRSHSLGAITTLDVRAERGNTPPAESSGFMLPTEVLVLPFPEHTLDTEEQWDFHLLSEQEFMMPSSPTNRMTESVTNIISTKVPSLTTDEPFSPDRRPRSNTVPTPKSPVTLSSEPVTNTWSPVKGAWLHTALSVTPEEESPYDRLPARGDTYITSSDSSLVASPVTTPTTTATEELLKEGANNDTRSIESTSPETTQTNKKKKRKKFWPFRKLKSVNGGKSQRDQEENKPRSQSDGTVLDEPEPRKRRSYTLLTGHITAKYAAINVRRRLRDTTLSEPIAMTTVMRLDPIPTSETAAERVPIVEMSSEEFSESLYCQQLKYKLRSALQNIHSPLALHTEHEPRGQLIMLIQQSLQYNQWQQDYMELSLLSEVKSMVELLSSDQVNVTIDGLYADHDRRSTYIAYLTKTHQRFQDARLQVGALQEAIDRLRAVDRELFVGFVVSQFLESRRVELQALVQEMASTLPADDKCSLMDSRQSSLREAVNNDPTWLWWNDMEGVVNCLDDQLFAHVYEHVFHPNGDSDTMRDQIYSRHLMRLSETITMSHNSLQIPAVYHNSCPWNSAQTHLKEMSIRKSPRGKVGCVVTCCKVLIGLLQLARCGDPPGADDMFPVIVYVLIKANPPGLLSTVQYVKNFIETILCGEDAYWWAQFSTAVEFTKTLE